ncbi:MaoC/PaaZ C-terminal domain-containing protein [Aestuariispira insulae]|uniref:Acyl dehydratase n=1 Tax=Aestuariispira insulae TaxID=1461337 RepID=A0A3D9HS40_9PROT|nr:MaoC/PaaZ C-terminal domain-containing protein [Aestuariispira insulae]RED52235.1 acyl dehydratase [Aestuariispira insulae]
MHSKYLDEFEAGQAYTTAKASLSEGQILDFAMMYDPQHMHIDHQAAETGPFGGVIASGFQTLSLSFRLFYDLGLIRQTNIIGVGMDELRWTAPVYPKDALQVMARVTEVRPSASKPDRGTLKWYLETINHKGDMVMHVDLIMILRRDPSQA